MSFQIEFLKDDSINKTLYTKGDKLYVSRSIRDDKISSGIAKEVVEKKVAAKATENKED
jgi:hypothetical protein